MGPSAPMASRKPNSARSSSRAAADSACCASGWPAYVVVGYKHAVVRARGCWAGEIRQPLP